MNSDTIKRVTALLQQTKKLLATQDRKDLIPVLEQSEINLTQRERVILVCGEFKRGKSSLINALLEQRNLCPVDIDIATAVVSIISYGEVPKVIRHFGAIGGTQQEEAPFDQISQYATGQGVANNDTWLLEIQTPCEYLKDGIVLIDTPGIGGLDPRHGFLTSYLMPRADVVLFTADAGEPLSESEVTFLKEKVTGATKPLVVVLNKIDKVDHPETQLADIRRKIVDTLGEDATSVVIVPVSSKLKLDYLREKSEEDLDESNYVHLEKAILSAIDNQEHSLVCFAIQTAVSILDDIRAPLQIQVKQLREDNNQNITDLKDRCAKQKERIQVLLDPAAVWRSELSQGLSDLRMEISTSLKVESIEITAQQRIAEIAVQSDICSNPNLVMKQIEESIHQMAEAANKRMVDGARQICVRLQEEHHLSINDDFDSQIFRYEGPRDLKAKRPTPGESVFTYVRQAGIGFSIGTGVGYVVMTLTNPFLGLGAALFTIYHSIKSGHQQLSQQRIQAIFATVTPEIHKALVVLNVYIEQRQREIERAFKEVTQQELNRAKVRYEEMAKALEGVIKRTAEQRKALDKVIKTKLEPIEQLLKYFERLTKTHTKSTDTTSKSARDASQEANLLNPIGA